MIGSEQASVEAGAICGDICATRKAGCIDNLWKELACDHATLRSTREAQKQIMGPGALCKFTKELIYIGVNVRNDALTARGRILLAEMPQQ